MLRLLNRLSLIVLVVSALACASAAATTVPTRGYFNSKGIYDCQVYNFVQHYFTTVDVYQFTPSGKYSVSIGRNGRTLDRPVHSGRYKLVGHKVVPTSGPLFRLHEYMKIETRALEVFKNNGHLTGMSCVLRYPAPPPPPAPPTALGTYSCYNTGEGSDGITTYYTSSFAISITLNNDGTYSSGNLGITGNWHQSGSSLVFTSGALWNNYAHDVGNLYPSGVTMPHAVAPLDPSTLYTLVIKDTVQEGGSPPSVEWSSTDGPNGTYSNPESFYYCKL